MNDGLSHEYFKSMFFALMKVLRKWMELILMMAVASLTLSTDAFTGMDVFGDELEFVGVSPLPRSLDRLCKIGASQWLVSA